MSLFPPLYWCGGGLYLALFCLAEKDGDCCPEQSLQDNNVMKLLMLSNPALICV